MMWYKGIRITLSALHKLKAEEVRFRMVFVGGGGDFDEIQTYARDLGIGDECVFTGPVRDREKLRAFYSAADLFLFPSTFDTNGLVVREAAAAGLASVLIQGSCAAEGVRDGKTGVLIEENPDAMAQTLLSIMRDRPAMRDLGERAMNGLYFSWEQSVDCAVERYREVIKGNVTLQKHKPGMDDRLYQSIGDAYNAMQKVRTLYEQARTRGTELLDDMMDRGEQMLDEARERHEARVTDEKKRRAAMIDQALGLADFYVDVRSDRNPRDK